jgi:hypothetical protein
MVPVLSLPLAELLARHWSADGGGLGSMVPLHLSLLSFISLSLSLLFARGRGSQCGAPHRTRDEIESVAKV